MFIGNWVQRVTCLIVIFFTGAILMCDVSLAREKTFSGEKRTDAMMKTDATDTEMSSPRSSEKEAANSKMGKKRKFPVLLVALGIGIVAGLILLLDKKKKDPQNPQSQTATYADGVLTVAGVRYELQAIPAGEFRMGSDSTEAAADESPVHNVRISRGFWLGKTEVTQGLWKAVMETNPSYFQSGDNYPVEMVSWDDCQRFIAKLNQMIGKTSFRLPTEAEWEYACRAGTTGERYGDLDAVAWYSANSGNVNHPVAQKLSNAWGLYDMLGNVYEWCSDWYSENYYGQSPSADPQGPASGTMRVSRGGCSFFDAVHTRAAHRQTAEPFHKNYGMGLRLAAVSSGS